VFIDSLQLQFFLQVIVRSLLFFLLIEIFVSSAHFLQLASTLKIAYIFDGRRHKGSTFVNMRMSLVWKCAVILRPFHLTSLPVAHCGAFVRIAPEGKFFSFFHITEIRRRLIRTRTGSLESQYSVWPLFSCLEVLSFNSVEASACLAHDARFAVLLVSAWPWKFLIELKSPPAASIDSRSFRVSIDCYIY